MTARTVNRARLALWLTLPSVSDKGLARLGIDRAIANRAGGLAWSQITIFGRGFDLSPSGFPAVIQPVWRGPAPSLECAVENPILDELIAWRPADPERWWYRWFASFPALGDHFIDDAHIDGVPLDCHMTPLAWLRGGCRGTVMLGIAEGFAEVAA
ncbi:MAG: hypothetical protein O7I42_04815 [Alphaproteobacteria bacterium]|nr:hypothetical protein [Alphaproteobacteria bacterium]